jgi:hypothetical protein
VRFTPQVKFTEAVARMSEPCVLVSVQTEQHANLIPTKLFDYLCTGNPVLVLSPDASASWDVARKYSRCHRLDLEPTEHNRKVLGRLFDLWRAGCLRQEASVVDTACLSKQPIGEQFVRLVEDTIAATSKSTA